MFENDCAIKLGIGFTPTSYRMRITGDELQIQSYKEWQMILDIRHGIDFVEIYGCKDVATEVIPDWSQASVPDVACKHH